MLVKTRAPAPASLPAKLTLALAACGLIVIAAQIRAQDATVTASDDPTPPAEHAAPAERPAYHPITLGLDAGLLNGLGGSVSWRFSDHFGIRAGINYFTYNFNGTIGGDATYDATLRLSCVPITLDLYPSRTSSFHVSIGYAFNGNQLTGVAVPTLEGANETITLNGVDYHMSDVGTLDIAWKQKRSNAYFTIAGNFFYFDPGHHVAFGGELGLMYGGKSTVSATRHGGTGDAALGAEIDANLQYERDQVQKYADYVTFWPIIKLGVNVSF